MKVKKGVLIQKMGRAYVAYDNEKSIMHEINETGFLILSGIEKGNTKSQIVKSLVRNFDVEKSEAEKDLEDFLKVLKKKKLL